MILDFEHPIEELFTAYPYVVTFATNSTDIWKLDETLQLKHHARLAQVLRYPGPITPILDDNVDTGLLAILNTEGNSPEICVFSIEYGTLLRTLWLYGDLAPTAPIYAAGRALIATSTPDKPELFLLDVAGEGWILGTGQLPSDLSHTAACLEAVHLHIEEDDEIGIVGAALAPPGQAEDITLLLWRGVPTETAQPAARLLLPLRMEDVDSVTITCSTSLSPSIFVFNVYESVSDAINTRFSRMSVVRAVKIVNNGLELKWESPADALYGHVSELIHVSAAHAVVAIGTQNAREDAGKDVLVSFIAVLDDETGELRRREDIRERILTCRVAHEKLVIVWRDGEVSAINMAEFVERGLPVRYGGGVETKIRRAGVLNNTVALLGDDGKVTLKTVVVDT
ncbi:hypothetical protein R3P38DRAFT_2902848 [Favolaschia claudopus]|uniref:Uncharacterized protein n=1 Tax=Favolaschia claudopus TaxID=2862362 RepID=A0AAW0CLZ0_9AGAR